MARKFGRELLEDFHISPETVFLNNGSFGACPLSVLAEQSQWRLQMEKQPIRFFMDTLPHAMESARNRMAAFVGAVPDGFVFVDNASTAVSTVVNSVMGQWTRGQRVVTTDHVYGAVRNTLKRACLEKDCQYVEISIPFPDYDPEECLRLIADELEKGACFALFDHITSPSGIVFPVEKIVHLCKTLGVPIMIDGAHAPGNIALNLESLGANWYTGNFHKWLFAPKGAAFLYCHSRERGEIHSLVVSHGYSKGLRAEFDFNGTRDYTPYLACPAGLDYFEYRGGWDSLAYKQNLLTYGRTALQERWPSIGCPPTVSTVMLLTFAVPFLVEADERATIALNRSLWQKYELEIPVILFKGKVWLRFSAHVFNEPSDYDYLVRCLWSEQERQPV